jgi:hypothetical protein
MEKLYTMNKCAAQIKENPPIQPAITDKAARSNINSAVWMLANRNSYLRLDLHIFSRACIFGKTLINKKKDTWIQNIILTCLEATPLAALSNFLEPEASGSGARRGGRRGRAGGAPHRDKVRWGRVWTPSLHLTVRHGVRHCIFQPAVRLPFPANSLCLARSRGTPHRERHRHPLPHQR